MVDEQVQPEPPDSYARVPDGFQRLWTPHRLAYVQSDKPTVDDESDTCPFCSAPERSDEDALVVARGRTCYAVLNLYPYNPGHVLICPYRHVPLYLDLTDEETLEFTAMTKQALRALEAASQPMGFNVGMNQGAVAGAGVTAHLHQHVVPRWGGDANFLPVVGQTKALPALLGDTRALLAQHWPAD